MSSSATPRTSAPPGIYAIDPSASTVAFVGKSLGGLVKARGTFALTAGRIEVTGPERASIEVTLDATSFDTGNPKRDTHVRSADFLDASRFPTIDYRATAVMSGESGWVVDGELTVKGVSASVPLTVASVEVLGATLRVRANTTVSRRALGVTKSRGMIGATLPVTLDITATMS